MLIFDGLEDALVGMSEVWLTTGAKVLRSVYDGNKMVEHFVKHGMTEEEAMEWISFNVEGAYVGESTPIVFWDYDPEYAYNSVDLDQNRSKI
jgi:hypothetical protein